MKKLFLYFTTLLLLNSYVALAQYIPVATYNVKWTERIQSITTSTYYNYFFTGDTIIAGKTYKKFVDSLELGYSGAIRNDTVNKKVYCVFKGDNKERLLYDFSANIGDTIRYIHYRENYSNFLDSAMVIPQSIDSVWDGTQYRTRWIMKYIIDAGFGQTNLWYFPVWIEGIGCVNSFIHLMEYVCPTPYMTCYQQNSTIFIQPLYSGTTLGNSTAFTDCIDYQNSLILSTHAKNLTSFVELYPNPVAKSNGDIYLKNANQYAQIQVLDIQGKILQTIVPTQDINAISVQEMQAGVYLLRCTQKNKIVHTQKIVVTE